MTKNEFLDKLKKALGNDLNGSIIQENVTYYNDYINEEVRKGRSETDVIAELGDPWVLAQTIIDGAEAGRNTQESYTYEPRKEYGGQDDFGYSRKVHVFGLDTWWKKLLLILGVIGVVMLVVAVIGGIFSLLAPILIPLVIIWFVFRILGNSRR